MAGYFVNSSTHGIATLRVHQKKSTQKPGTKQNIHTKKPSIGGEDSSFMVENLPKKIGSFCLFGAALIHELSRGCDKLAAKIF